MSGHEGTPHAGGGKEIARLELFSDAVFAIAITLLVLELKVPEHEAVQAAGGLGKALVLEIPRFYAYLISFTVIGNYWMVHHRMFRYLRRCDEGLVALNLLLLFFVAFLPFPVALFGTYRREWLAIGWYVVSLLLTGLSLNLVWWYAAGPRRLVVAELDRRVAAYVQFRAAAIPLLFTISLPFAFVNPKWTAFSAAAMVLPLRFLGGRLGRAARAAEEEQRGGPGTAPAISPKLATGGTAASAQSGPQPAAPMRPGTGPTATGGPASAAPPPA